MPTFADQLGERQYVSQYAADKVGVVVHKAGVPADADANLVTVTMKTLDDVTTVFSRDADHPATGTYETTLLSSESATPGLYKLTWDYTVDSTPQSYVGIVEVGEASPTYDSLSIGFKGIVESAWMRFADLFDSPVGGPHLQVYFQSRFTRGRMAQLLNIAVGKLNTYAQPHTTYSLDTSGKPFPFEQWGGLLDEALYIEALKHLIRSYVEQPAAEAVSVSRLDRRDYMQRWADVLQMEQVDFKEQAEVFKIAHMGLSKSRVLVGGGVYGNYGPTRIAGSVAARPRYWARFY
jgi:hypothetical protein